ncbi:hypothetical protein ACFQX7_30350 [Luedemannella flava]
MTGAGALVREVRRLGGGRRLARLAVAGLVAAGTELCGLALLGTATWLLVTAAGQPPLAALTVAIVGVRTFAIARGAGRYLDRLVSHDAALRVLADVRTAAFAAMVRLPARAAPAAPGGPGETGSRGWSRTSTACRTCCCGACFRRGHGRDRRGGRRRHRRCPAGRRVAAGHRPDAGRDPVARRGLPRRAAGRGRARRRAGGRDRRRRRRPRTAPLTSSRRVRTVPRSPTPQGAPTGWPPSNAGPAGRPRP